MTHFRRLSISHSSPQCLQCLPTIIRQAEMPLDASAATIIRRPALAIRRAHALEPHFTRSPGMPPFSSITAIFFDFRFSRAYKGQRLSPHIANIYYSIVFHLLRGQSHACAHPYLFLECFHFFSFLHDRKSYRTAEAHAKKCYLMGRMLSTMKKLRRQITAHTIAVASSISHCQDNRPRDRRWPRQAFGAHSRAFRRRRRHCAPIDFRRLISLYNTHAMLLGQGRKPRSIFSLFPLGMPDGTLIRPRIIFDDTARRHFHYLATRRSCARAIGQRLAARHRRPALPSPVAYSHAHASNILTQQR